MDTTRFHTACVEYEALVQELYQWAVTRHGYGYVAVDDAPETEDGILRAWLQASSVGYFPVYGGGCNRTVFSRASSNLMFRYLHDHGHVECAFGLTLDGELGLAKLWGEELRRCGASEDVILLANIDTAGQALYYAEHQQHVDDQRSFAFERFQKETIQ